MSCADCSAGPLLLRGSLVGGLHVAHEPQQHGRFRPEPLLVRGLAHIGGRGNTLDGRLRRSLTGVRHMRRHASLGTLPRCVRLVELLALGRAERAWIAEAGAWGCLLMPLVVAAVDGCCWRGCAGPVPARVCVWGWAACRPGGRCARIAVPREAASGAGCGWLVGMETGRGASACRVGC